MKMLNFSGKSIIKQKNKIKALEKSISNALACRKKFNYKFLHAGRLRESKINFVFCERVLYVGTAPEQKTKSAKSGLNVMFKPLFYKCIFDFISARASPCPTSSLYDNLSTARFSHFIDSLSVGVFLQRFNFAFIN